MTDLPNPAPEFEPTPYLTNVSGAKYLEVKWRLVWLRKAYPQALITTEQVAHEPGKWAAFKATVEIPVEEGVGGGVATGHGMEEKGDFRDYYEKAETKALGRALAALGFGTQFAPEFADPATAPELPQNQRNEANRYQDTNTVRSVPQQAAPHGYGAQQAQGTPRPGPGPVSEKQIGLIWRLAGDVDINATQMAAMIRDTFNTETVDQLSKADASRLIDHLNDLRRGGTYGS